MGKVQLVPNTFLGRHKQPHKQPFVASCDFLGNCIFSGLVLISVRYEAHAIVKFKRIGFLTNRNSSDAWSFGNGKVNNSEPQMPTNDDA